MFQTLPNTEQLPHALYRAEQVRSLDRTAINDHGIAGMTLMERAGAAAFQLLRKRWPQAQDITVVCGAGNNGGDGFVVARLARAAGMDVQLLQLGNPEKLQGDALTAADAWRTAGGVIIPFETLPRRCDLIVDAVFGTGLEREVSGGWRTAIELINRHQAPVLAIDIPSGLNADTGAVLGVAVRAQATISFIGLKQGMFTGAGPEQCGDVSFDGLGVPAVIYSQEILSARRVDWRQQSTLLTPRSRSAHKGDFGHLLLIGGDLGYSGAVRMAGEAAARSGTGLISIATRPHHAALLTVQRPELMCHAVDDVKQLSPLLRRATVVAIGPGLGRSEWSLRLLGRALESRLPLVVDADGLNLLAQDPTCRDDWILTPHPGEAARLLDCTTGEIECDRFAAVTRLQERYGGVIVLKGAGTLIKGASSRPIALCTEGNPGMASGGMGDLLTGIIGSLLAQGFDAEDAACMGVSLHGAAADQAAGKDGERGMLASDLLPEIRRLINSSA